MSAAPIQPLGAFSLAGPLSQLTDQIGAPQVARSGGASFSGMLLDGIDHVSAKLTEADNMVRSFALDDSIPVHQVTFALEQARLSLELMLQVRGRLVEGYQQLMNMQL